MDQIGLLGELAEMTKRAETAEALLREWRVKLGACTESRLAIIEMMIMEMGHCADAFDECYRGGCPCWCGSAAKNVRAIVNRLREQRPNVELREKE